MYRVIRQVLKNGKKGKQKKVGRLLVRSMHTRAFFNNRTSLLRNRHSLSFKNGRVACLTTSKRTFSTYRIHLAIGVARLGDSIGYYDEPTTIGGLPTIPGTKKEVTKFRDDTINRGLLRQASVFNIYNDDGEIIDLEQEG